MQFLLDLFDFTTNLSTYILQIGHIKNYFYLFIPYSFIYILEILHRYVICCLTYLKHYWK